MNIEQLEAFGIRHDKALLFLAPIRETCAQFLIDQPRRVAAFMAQYAFESMNFMRMEEGLFYKDPQRILRIFPRSVTSIEQANTLVGKPEALANVVYANKNGNGSTASGDGYRYRGRGLCQLTGRNNYTAASLALARPYLDQPDLVALPADACLTAGWYWNRTACNSMADAGDIYGITRAINGSGMVGAQERRDLYVKALSIFTN